MTLAKELGAFAAALRYEDIPLEARERAKRLILDAIGCGLAARRFGFAAPSLRAAAELGGSGPRAVLGQAPRLPLRDAVLANGILMHGLDYDDTHTEGIVHLTVSALPAALGVAAQLGRHGRDLLAAYVAALEAGARIGAAAKGAFHQVGFHPTGVVGAFACALAAGKLQGLDADGLARAQGIALSVASGSLEFLADGAWTKRFHPGWAAVGGITAAAYAKHGFVAPPAPYEGRFGLFAGYLGALASGCDLKGIGKDLGSAWETLQVAVKPYPACHFVHAFIDAALELRRAGVRAEEVERITALVPAEVVKTVCEPAAAKHRPANDYDARFSIPYVVAAALRAGRFGLAELDAAALRDPATLALAAKVDYEVDPRSTFPRHYGGEIAVRLLEGKEMRHREAVNRGCAERPLSDADIAAKFAANASYGGSSSRIEAIREAVLALDEHPARALEDALAAA